MIGRDEIYYLIMEGELDGDRTTYIRSGLSALHHQCPEAYHRLMDMAAKRLDASLIIIERVVMAYLLAGWCMDSQRLN